MRQHAFLRREMIGGIRLLSPYCQTASANYDCYTGISTWGNDRERPISYMTNDYDHGAMIKADGSVTEEYLEARLLGNLILALGEHLAAGRRLEAGGGLRKAGRTAGNSSAEKWRMAVDSGQSR